MPRDYAALIVDIKKSRSYTVEDRNSIQHFIMQTLQLLNQMFSQELVREVDFSAGDEVQGLFSSSESAYQYYRMLSMWLHPIELRAGIGVGEWSVQLESKGSTGQDGPAYHKARYAIENADDGEGYPILLFSGNKSDVTINTIIGGAASLMAKQSIPQNQIMLITEMMYPICNCHIFRYDSESSADVRELLHAKSEFAHTTEKNARPFPIDRLNNNIIVLCNYVNEEEPSKPPTFYITSGKRRGIPTQLSNIMDISRQNIEKTFRAGNIYTSRNMAIAAINEMTSTRREK